MAAGCHHPEKSVLWLLITSWNKRLDALIISEKIINSTIQDTFLSLQVLINSPIGFQPMNCMHVLTVLPSLLKPRAVLT